MRISCNCFRSPSWLFPISLATCAAITAFLVASVLPRTYSSRATLFFPSPPDASGSILGSLASSLKGPGLGLSSDKGGQVSLLNGALTSQLVASGPQTAVAVMDSTLCRQRVVDQLGLSRRWNLPQHKALSKLESIVSMGIDKNGLLAMEVTERDPSLGEQILHAYIQTLRMLAERLSLNISKRNRVFVEKRVGESRGRIADIESKLLALDLSDPDPVVTTSPNDAARGIVDLEKDLLIARVGLSASSRALEHAMQNAREIVRSGLDLPAHTDMAHTQRAKLAELEYEFSLKKAELGPDNPQFRLLQQQVVSAREQLRVEIARQARAIDKGIAPEITKLSAEKEGLLAQVDGLSRAVDQVKARLAAIPTRQAARERLVQELKVLRDLFEYQVIELGKAQIAEERDATSFQVIDAPSHPVEPSSPRRLYATGMAGVAGLLLGIAMLIVQSASRRDPLSPDSLENSI